MNWKNYRNDDSVANRYNSREVCLNDRFTHIYKLIRFFNQESEVSK